MASQIESTTMHKTKNPIATDVRQGLCDRLNSLLANGIDLKLRAKQAHWNLKGHDFIALHELFDKFAAENDEIIDSLAERIVQLGGQAYGTLQTAISRTELAPYDGEATDQSAHLRMYTDDLAVMIEHFQQAAEYFAEHDPLSEDLMIEIGRMLGQQLYFTESHL